jgi:hypothetical protein
MVFLVLKSNNKPINASIVEARDYGPGEMHMGLQNSDLIGSEVDPPSLTA